MNRDQKRQWTMTLVLGATILLLTFCCAEALPQNPADPLNNALNMPNEVLGFFQNMFNNVVQGLPNIMTMFAGPSVNAPSNPAAIAGGAIPSMPAKPTQPDRDIEEMDAGDYSPKIKDVEVFRNDVEPFNE